MKFTINNDEQCRLDRFLRRHISPIPQSVIEKALRNSLILVNGKKSTSNYRLAKGDEVLCTLELSEKIVAPKEDQKLFKKFESWVIYQDDALCVINKPYGMPTQGGSKIYYSVDQMANSAKEKYHIVHRLDRYTTGLLVLAKSPAVANQLMHAFRDRLVKKYYVAVVQCNSNLKDSGLIDKPLAKVLSYGEEKMMIDESVGKKALTRYRVVKFLPGKKALLLVKPLSGRKHQIRVHLASIGCPIVGDSKYGEESSEKLHLHAYKISFNIGKQQNFVCKPSW